MSTAYPTQADVEKLIEPTNTNDDIVDDNIQDKPIQLTSDGKTILTPDAKFIKARWATPLDIEDVGLVVLNKVCRPRPDKIKWMCTFRRKLIPHEIYQWCQCGKSEDIYCDNTCKEEPTRLGPFEFSVKAKVSMHALCGCRFTAAPPFCDGSHSVNVWDMEEWLELHPEEKERVPWLNKDENGNIIVPQTNNDDNNVVLRKCCGGCGNNSNDEEIIEGHTCPKGKQCATDNDCSTEQQKTCADNNQCAHDENITK